MFFNWFFSINEFFMYLEMNVISVGGLFLEFRLKKED